MNLTGERLYKLGEDGKEYLFYKSKKQGVIVRDMYLTDALPYYNAMILPAGELSQERKKDFLNYVQKLITERDTYNDTDYTLLATNLSGKILGSIDVRIMEPSSISVKIFLRRTKEGAGGQILKTIKEMQQEYYWYDKIFIDNGDSKVLAGKLWIK